MDRQRRSLIEKEKEVQNALFEIQKQLLQKQRSDQKAIEENREKRRIASQLARIKKAQEELDMKDSIARLKKETRNLKSSSRPGILRKENERLRKELTTLRTENDDLRIKNIFQETEIKNLTDKLLYTIDELAEQKQKNYVDREEYINFDLREEDTFFVPCSI